MFLKTADYYDRFFEDENDKSVSRVIKVNTFVSSDVANVRMHVNQNYFESIQGHKWTDQF